MLQLATATGVPGGRHDCIRREADRAPCANEINTPPLQRFAQRLQRIAPEFTDLIKQQESAMRPGELAGHHARASADEPRHRDVVMRCSQRWTY
jgi:hypothetical protein